MSDEAGTASRRGVLAGGALGALVAAGGARAAAKGEAKIWSREYWANKGAVKLYIYRKRIGAPVKGKAGKPVVFLIHGSTLAGRSTYDLKAGDQDLSMMDMLARAGFDVWTMDHEGYGHSSHTEANGDLEAGVADIEAAMPVIEAETGRSKIHFFGESSGALRVGMYANRHPEKIDKLMLAALSYTGIGSPTLIERAKQLDYWKSHNRRPRDKAMITSIFTRDGLTASPVLVDKIVAEEMKFGDSVPTGTYLDMTTKLPVVDPVKITSPVLILRGEHDGIATIEDVLDFYRKVPGDEKQFALVPGAHTLVQGPGYRQMWHTVQAFLTMPLKEG